jgi:sulfhydrogenase subunit gamma (sulfur reductase)
MSALLTSNGSAGLMTPHLGRLVAVQDMAPEIKLLRVEMLDGDAGPFARWQPGQFAFLSAFGVGEAPFGIASTPERGPCLDGFPMEAFKGKDLLVMGGGIGGAPLRPVLHTILDHRGDYGHLTILWAARNPSLLLFRDEYDTWRSAPNTELAVTVDEGDDGWEGEVGLITALLEKVAPTPRNAVAITCGPPIMIYHVDKLLRKMGFTPEQSYVTLEARMHCGVGKCGRCNLGDTLICTDGPVFSMAEVDRFPESFV